MSLLTRAVLGKSGIGGEGLNNLACPLFLGVGENGREGRIGEVEKMI